MPDRKPHQWMVTHARVFKDRSYKCHYPVPTRSEADDYAAELRSRGFSAVKVVPIVR